MAGDEAFVGNTLSPLSALFDNLPEGVKESEEARAHRVACEAAIAFASNQAKALGAEAAGVPDEKDLDEDDAAAYSTMQGMLTSLTNGAPATDGAVAVDKLATIQKSMEEMVAKVKGRHVAARSSLKAVAKRHGVTKGGLAKGSAIASSVLSAVGLAQPVA